MVVCQSGMGAAVPGPLHLGGDPAEVAVGFDPWREATAGQRCPGTGSESWSGLGGKAP